MISLGVIIAAVAIIIGRPIVNGWVASILWAWFLVPLGAPAISVVPAIGIALIVGCLTHQYPWRAPGEKQKTWPQLLGEGAAKIIAYPMVTLGTGALIRWAL